MHIAKRLSRTNSMFYYIKKEIIFYNCVTMIIIPAIYLIVLLSSAHKQSRNILLLVPSLRLIEILTKIIEKETLQSKWIAVAVQLIKFNSMLINTKEAGKDFFRLQKVFFKYKLHCAVAIATVFLHWIHCAVAIATVFLQHQSSWNSEYKSKGCLAVVGDWED